MKKTAILFIVLCAVLFKKSYGQYCIPNYTFTPFGCSDVNGGDVIDDFWTTGGVANITNMNTGCTGDYTYYSSLTASQVQGQSINVNMQCGPTFQEGFRIWIDWNNDFDFQDPGEDVFASTAATLAVQSGSFVVPFSATPGVKRMRVLCRYAVVPNLTDDCSQTMSFGECEDYNFNVIAATPCTGQPVAGTTTSSIALPCLGQSFVLGLNGTTAAGGLTYQWIQSTTGNPGTWTLVTGATNNFLQTSVTTNMCFRCIVTCSTSALFDTSSSFCVNPGFFSPLSSCYCPCTNQGSSCITNVTLGTLNNTTTGCPSAGFPNFNFFTTPVPNLVSGLNYLFTVTCNAAAITSFWIDYNHNTSFEPSEWYQPDINAVVGDTLFTIPTTALPGPTRMRVRSRLPGNQNGSGDACIAMGSGETEDYIVNILPAVPHDPAVTALNVPNGNCFSANSNFSVVLTNYGQQSINLAINPVTVTLNLQTPNGPATYSNTLSTGTLQASGANTLNLLISGVNLFAGGLYTVNTSLTIGNANNVQNTILQDDSLASPITLQNYRPKPGPAYNLCQFGSIPLGQGLTVSGCATPINDSVTINFTLSNSGTIPCLPTQNNILGACLFASGTIPVLPNPTFQSAELTVTNLATANGGWAQETRFPIFKGNVPSGTPLYPTLQGNPATTSANYTWYNSIPVTTFSAIYDSIISGGGSIKLGYNSTWSGNATSNGFTQNAGANTVATLKIKYSYVPNNYVWFEVPSGGTSIYNSSPFNPLAVTNSVVSNSNTPGNYIFYVACGPSPNCRAADTLRINPAPVANNVTTHNCESAVASNTSTFNLVALGPQITSNASYAINYYYDPGFFLSVPTPSANVSGSSTIYVNVQNPSNGCSTPVVVNQVVDTLPDIQTVSQALVCSPASLNAANLIDYGFSVIPSNSTISYFTNAACTIPHPNPTNITTAGSVYIVVATNTTPSCKDTAQGIVNISAASNNIVNQLFIGPYTYSSPMSVDPINTAFKAYADGLSGDILTANCKKMVKVTDLANGVSLGNVAADVFIGDNVITHNGQPYLKRYFKITPTTQDSAMVCLYVLQEDFNEYNAYADTSGWPLMANPTLTNVAVSKVDNGDINTPGHTFTLIPTSAITATYSGSPDEVWSLCFKVDSFSYFYVHAMNANNSALPVIWKSVTGKRVEMTSVIDWTTSSEKNNNYYVVERSRDSKFFNIISERINSKGVNGNSDLPLSYQFIDPTPYEGHNYYRIRQYDKDANEHLSKVVDVYFGTDSKITVYPNPVSDEMTVDILVTKSTNATIKLLDATGRVVKVVNSPLTAGNNPIVIKTDDLANGVYMLKISNDKGLNYSQSIRKN